MRHELVPARLGHALLVAHRLRKDRPEVPGGASVRDSIVYYLRHSGWSRALLIDGRCMAVGGAIGPLLASEAHVWCAVTPQGKDHRRALLRGAREGIGELLNTWSGLSAVIIADCEESLRFARHLGFVLFPDKAQEGAVRVRSAKYLGTIQPRRQTARRERPFIIYTAGRSRTAWLSTYLSYGGWTCRHDAAIDFRAPADIGEFFRRPRTGSVETAASPAWALVKHYAPEARVAVILRPAGEVIDSVERYFSAAGIEWDREKLRHLMEYEVRLLNRVALLPGTLAIDYSQLGRAGVCAELFEFCLPYRFDPVWHERLAAENIQVDVRDYVLRYQADREAIEGFKRACKADLRRLARAGDIRAQAT